MSIANTMFYNIADRVTNKETYDGLTNELSAQLAQLTATQEKYNEDIVDGFDQVNRTFDEVINDESPSSMLTMQLKELSDINNVEDEHYRSFVQYADESLNHKYSTEIDEINDHAWSGLIGLMRVSTFKVEVVNAFNDIVLPLTSSMALIFKDQNDEQLRLHHEDMLYQSRIISALQALNTHNADMGRGIVLALKEFTRHPIWYTLYGAVQALKFLTEGSFRLLFGFGDRRSVQEKILHETKRQTEFLMTGRIDDSKNLWQQFKSGGIAGLIGRDVASVLGVGLEKAQERENKRAQGELVSNSFVGKFADRFFGKETIKSGKPGGITGDNGQMVLLKAVETGNELLEKILLKMDSLGFSDRVDKTNSLLLSQTESLSDVLKQTQTLYIDQNGFITDIFNNDSIREKEIVNVNQRNHEESISIVSSMSDIFKEYKSDDERNQTIIKDLIGRDNVTQEEFIETILPLLTNSLYSNIQIRDTLTEGNDTKEGILGVNKNQLREDKKANRRLMIANLVGVLNTIGSVFSGMFNGKTPFLKLLGAGLGASMIPSFIDGLKLGETGTLADSVKRAAAATFVGLILGGIKLAKVSGAFVIGTEIGRFLNDYLINPLVEFFTGRDGETLGGAIFEWQESIRGKFGTNMTQAAEHKIAQERREQRRLTQLESNNRRDEILRPYREQASQIQSLISSGTIPKEQLKFYTEELARLMIKINDPQTVEDAIREQIEQEEKNNKSLMNSIKDGSSSINNTLRSLISSGVSSFGRSPEQTASEVHNLLDVIGKYESRGNYNALVYGNGKTPTETDLTSMTIEEVQQYQKGMIDRGHASTAVGKYQVIENTLSETVRKLGLDPKTTKFDENTQDMIAIELMKGRGLEAYLQNPNDETFAKFQNELAREWASLPYDSSGRGHYDGKNRNKANVEAHADLQRARPTMEQNIASNNGVVSTPIMNVSSSAKTVDTSSVISGEETSTLMIRETPAPTVNTNGVTRTVEQQPIQQTQQPSDSNALVGYMKELVEIAREGGIVFGGTPDSNTINLVYGG
jgi:muramidase (phage lysozyme)